MKVTKAILAVLFVATILFLLSLILLPVKKYSNAKYTADVETVEEKIDVLMVMTSKKDKDYRTSFEVISDLKDAIDEKNREELKKQKALEKKRQEKKEKEKAEKKRIKEEQIKQEQKIAEERRLAEQKKQEEIRMAEQKKQKQKEEQKRLEEEKKQKTQSQSQFEPSGNYTEMTVEATAYTAYCNGCSGLTATGIDLRSNPNQKVIAVDPNVIPLGSKVYVEGYGTAIAGDTGGAIKGNRIDVFIPDDQKVYNWGRRQVNIKVYK